MRRAYSVLLHRNLAAARHGSAASIAVPNRFLQATLYGTTAGSSPSSRRWFSSILAAVAGTTLGVGGLIAANSASHEVLAKERPPSDALPSEVVLYQYEACPFCNKVKGENTGWFLLLAFRFVRWFEIMICYFHFLEIGIDYLLLLYFLFRFIELIWYLFSFAQLQRYIISLAENNELNMKTSIQYELNNVLEWENLTMVNDQRIEVVRW